MDNMNLYIYIYVYIFFSLVHDDRTIHKKKTKWIQHNLKGKRIMKSKEKEIEMCSLKWQIKNVQIEQN